MLGSVWHTGSDVTPLEVQTERLKAYPINSKETTVVTQQRHDIIISIIQIICKRMERKNKQRTDVTSRKQNKIIDLNLSIPEATLNINAQFIVPTKR